MTREQMRRGVVGKYASHATDRVLVALDADVAKVFKDSERVNQILRAIIESMQPESKLKKSA